MSIHERESTCERVDLDQVEDPRDAVHRAVACMVQGGIVGFPSETGIDFAANATRSDSVFFLDQHRGLGRPPAFVVAVRDLAALADWVPRLSATITKLINRAWPGSTLFEFGDCLPSGLASTLPEKIQRSLLQEGRLIFGSPSSQFFREVAALLPCPVAMLATPPGTVLGANGAQPLLVFESTTPGPRRGWPSTLVRVEGDSWTVVRAGAVSAEELVSMSGTSVLFVCTGNTCRSPMAEALCKALLADRLGCSVDDLAERGYQVGSAGVYASNGTPAASNAIEVVSQRGGSLVGHASRRVSAELLERADHIIALTVEHREALLDIAPELADRCRLLHPEGLDVDDPYGSDLQSYERTANEIEIYLEQLLDDLGL